MGKKKPLLNLSSSEAYHIQSVKVYRKACFMLKGIARVLLLVSFQIHGNSNMDSKGFGHNHSSSSSFREQNSE